MMTRDEKTQRDLVANLVGRARMDDALNCKGSLGPLLEDLDWLAMVDEALGVRS